LKVNRRFGGACHNHLQGRRISRARNQLEIGWQARPKYQFVEILQLPGKKYLFIFLKDTSHDDDDDDDGDENDDDDDDENNNLVGAREETF
jgi:hypothetical protein